MLNAGRLKAHTPTPGELKAHIDEAANLLSDSGIKGISVSGKFTCAYGAAHALAVAAFKINGYRIDDDKGHRQTLFAALEHAVPATEGDKAIFEKAHRDRNNAEYQGMRVQYSESELEALVDAVRNLQEEVDHLFRQWKKNQPGGSR
jgi:hypothetical protein